MNPLVVRENVLIWAPWSEEQVQALNRFQQLGIMHPFTCGKRDNHREDDGILIASEAGWHCPAWNCDYIQTWAYLGMTDHDFMDRQVAFIENMRRRAQQHQ